MSSTQYDATVIGAGTGGSSCAALLAKQGLKILLVGKSPQPGGRMMTLDRNRFPYELFPLLGLPAGESHFETLLQRVESTANCGPAVAPRVSHDPAMPGHGGECVGLAQVVGQCGRHRPSPESPIQALPCSYRCRRLRYGNA